MATPERLEAEPLPHNVKRVASDIAGWPKALSGRSTDPDRATLEANKNFFNVARLFEQVKYAIGAGLPALTAREYPIGVWYVREHGRGKRTNYIGVDVAREFPGAVGIQVFLAAASLTGAEAVAALRSKHKWQEGRRYYPQAKDDRHRVHTFFLIPSLDYWERHQGDFLKLAADVNAAMG